MTDYRVLAFVRNKNRLFQEVIVPDLQVKLDLPRNIFDFKIWFKVLFEDLFKDDLSEALIKKDEQSNTKTLLLKKRILPVKLIIAYLGNVQQIFLQEQLQKYVNQQVGLRIYPSKTDNWKVKENGKPYRWQVLDLTLENQTLIPQRIGLGTTIVFSTGVLLSSLYGVLVNSATGVPLPFSLLGIAGGARVAFLTYTNTELREEIEKLFQPFFNYLPNPNPELLEKHFEVVGPKQFSNKTRTILGLDMLCVACVLYVTYLSTYENYKKNIADGYDDFLGSIIENLSEYLPLPAVVAVSILAFTLTFIFNTGLGPINMAYVTFCI